MQTTRFVSDLVGRVGGPFSFRFILQPVMGLIYALRDGIKDAKEDRPAFFWALFTDPDVRPELLREIWKSVGRVILLGFGMEIAYQLIQFRWIYPVEMIVMVLVLAVLPYVLLRGPINRIARLFVTPRVTQR